MLAAQALFGVAPIRRHMGKLAAWLDTDQVQQICVVIVSVTAVADFAPMLAPHVYHLVFEDANQPGLELRASLKRLWFNQDRQHSFCHRIFRPGAVAQLQAGKTQQIVMVADDLLIKRKDWRGGLAVHCV